MTVHCLGDATRRRVTVGYRTRRVRHIGNTGVLPRLNIATAEEKQVCKGISQNLFILLVEIGFSNEYKYKENNHKIN